MATKTLVITNFTGRLTRNINGDLDSGFAKFDTSWGYDPFLKPGNLTWNYQTSSVLLQTSSIGGAPVNGMPLAILKRQDAFFYMLDNVGRYYYGKNSTAIYSSGIIGFDPLDDSIQSVLANVPDTYDNGGAMANYLNRVFISGDSNITSLNGSTSNAGPPQSIVGTTGSVFSGPHPLKEFQGKLYYGNGNNIGEITDANQFGLVTTGTKLSPALPAGMTITDLDVTPEGDYLLMTASQSTPPYYGSVTLAWTGSTPQRNYAADSAVYYWNGSDDAATAVSQLPSFPATALSTFLDQRYTVIQDAFGMALLEGNKKLLTMPNNNTPLANALSPNGTFLTWVSQEGVNDTVGALAGRVVYNYSSVFTSLYYFGQLDDGQPAGLWRMMRISPQAGNYTTQYVPVNTMVNNYSSYSNNVWGMGKHLIGTQEGRVGSYSSVVGKLHRFVLDPGNVVLQSPVGGFPVANGVYETQTQLFSKRIGISQIRVYTEPTISSSGFQLDLIGAGGAVLENGTFTYTYGDTPDPQSGSLSLERINFNPDTKTQYSLGIRITNKGTAQMTIKKVEIDLSEEGK